MIDAYLSITPNTSGVRAVSPETSAVTGYDFIADTAEAVKTNLDAGTGEKPDAAPPGGDALIQPYGHGTNPRTRRSHQHLDRHRARQPRPREPGTTSRSSRATSAPRARSPPTTSPSSRRRSSMRGPAPWARPTPAKTNLVNTILFSIGCHSGYNTVDGHAIPRRDRAARLAAGVRPQGHHRGRRVPATSTATRTSSSTASASTSSSRSSSGMALPARRWRWVTRCRLEDRLPLADLRRRRPPPEVAPRGRPLRPADAGRGLHERSPRDSPRTVPAASTSRGPAGHRPEVGRR